jgi:hypothetical protein
MPIEVYPVPVASSINASAITATTSNTMYEGIIALDPAIYTVTCPSGTITNIHFFSGSTLITTVITASGTISLNLASAADRVRLWTDTGSSVVVTITKTASALSDVFSGTLDTVTSTGTYTGTSTSGKAYAVLVGGGGGGGGSTGTASGSGGGSGSVGGKLVTLTGSMSVTIGAAGVGAIDTDGTNGGTSTFAGMSCPGGGGGGKYVGGVAAVPGSAGAAPTGTDVSAVGREGATPQYSGSSTTKIYSFVVNGTTGSGGGGNSGQNLGGGSGIGTGGNGSGSGNGGDATGYGSGGGGSGGQFSSGNYRGGNGRPGVLYILRF